MVCGDLRWFALVCLLVIPDHDSRNFTLTYQVVLLQTAHSWANAGVLLDARMHRERGSFRNN